MKVVARDRCLRLLSESSKEVAMGDRRVGLGAATCLARHLPRHVSCLHPSAIPLTDLWHPWALATTCVRGLYSTLAIVTMHPSIATVPSPVVSFTP